MENINGMMFNTRERGTRTTAGKTCNSRRLTMKIAMFPLQPVLGKMHQRSGRTDVPHPFSQVDYAGKHLVQMCDNL